MLSGTQAAAQEEAPQVHACGRASLHTSISTAQGFLWVGFMVSPQVRARLKAPFESRV